MATHLEKWPKWSETALQGLAFWMGHRHALYRHYPLGEAALVAEACNLIYANLRDGQILICERQYTQMMPPGAWPEELGKKSRADLVVVKDVTQAQAANGPIPMQHVVAVIEVKRASAPKAHIDQDLQRLFTFKEANAHVLAFLFVVAESNRPKRFVNAEGNAIRGKHVIRTGGHFRVRRSCKAAASFGGSESAHYACLIEVTK